MVPNTSRQPLRPEDVRDATPSTRFTSLAPGGGSNRWLGMEWPTIHSPSGI